MRRPPARDIERAYPRRQFVEKLRRLADALETGAPFTIQVARERLWVPADVAFNIEHERASGAHELEFQLRWTELSGDARISRTKANGRKSQKKRVRKERR